MAARFTVLNNALEKGVETMKADAGVKQVEYWENELKGADFPGAKGLLHDLESLKKKLQADEPDGDAIKKLLAKLGGETTKAAGRAEDEAVAEKLTEVGGKLEKAAA